MATKIRLKRLGKIRVPHYRVIVIDSRAKRDGRPIEEIGQYHPKNDPSVITIDSERVQYWLGVGAQPTEPVIALLKRTGDWQKFTGDKSPSGVLEQAPRPDKAAIFNAALAESDGEPTESATTVTRRGKKVMEAADQITEALAGKPADDDPDVEAPIVEAPAKKAPVKEAPVKEAPVEEAPAEEAPVEEAPVEEAPAEEAPAEAEPAEEAPAEVPDEVLAEKPAKKPTARKPAAKKPADDAPAAAETPVEEA